MKGSGHGPKPRGEGRGPVQSPTSPQQGAQYPRERGTQRNATGPAPQGFQPVRAGARASLHSPPEPLGWLQLHGASPQSSQIPGAPKSQRESWYFVNSMTAPRVWETRGLVLFQRGNKANQSISNRSNCLRLALFCFVLGFFLKLFQNSQDGREHSNSHFHSAQERNLFLQLFPQKLI